MTMIKYCDTSLLIKDCQLANTVHAHQSYYFYFILLMDGGGESFCI